jgi:hypothetical protein
MTIYRSENGIEMIDLVKRLCAEYNAHDIVTVKREAEYDREETGSRIVGIGPGVNGEPVIIIENW